MSESFRKTRWSLVLQIQKPEDNSSRSRALEELCQLYWKPLYWFARRSGSTAEQAEDHVQEFFTRLIEGDWLDRANADRGKLRTFLLTLLKRHLNDHRKGRNAKKRGSGVAPLSLETAEIERRLASPGEEAGTSVEFEFDRNWAFTVFECSLAQLRSDYEKKDRLSLFEALRPLLTGQSNQSIREVATNLGISDGAAHVALHRMRRQLREILRIEVADTLLPGDDLEEEIRYLASLL